MNNDYILSEQDYIEAANSLNLDTALIKAVAKIESSGSGFLSSGLPTILFEGHVFWKYLKQKNKLNNVLSNYKNINDILYEKWTKKYYLGGEKEYTRFNRAKEIDYECAICATSYGMFQIMGFNSDICLCTSVLEFELLNQISAKNQLLLFCNFIYANKLDTYLRKLDFTGFATRYNGPGQAQNQYDVKLKNAYLSFS